MANPNIAAEQLLELLLTLKKTTPAAARGILNSQPAIAYALITLMVSMNAIDIEVFQKTLAEFGASSSAEPSNSIPAGHAVGGPSSINSTTPQLLPTLAAPAPISAIPLHLQAQYRTSTPPTASSSVPPAASSAPTHTPTPPYGYGSTNGPGANATPTPSGAYGSYGQPAYGQGYGYQQPPAPAAYQQPAYQQQSPYQQYQQQGGYPGYPSYQQQPQAPTPAVTQTPTPALPEALAGIPEEQKALIMRVLSMTPEQINMLPPSERATYIQIRATLGVPTPAG
ncbi:hypothetical protein GALMADRAFT_132632 [Galerina marginata CBS 339.88]|uniref:Transcription termination and cleavage factor C-terminal domain-containing protein n=1 Tax=Galerina marginata (strain CBS 339.88) TaxID=685588 RepID=A0A067TS36_GALM3|nr:hypothetical protein GALMADRAFT_132632 [Galerina marginata CBS 339.88]